MALGAGGVLAACDSGGDSGEQSTSGPPRRGGTLTAGLTGGSSADSLDPNLPVSNTDYARLTNLYDSLVWQDAKAQPYLRVAEEVTPNKDATVWTIRLRKGVMFHDGKEATADDLIFSLKRVVDPKAPGIAANALHGLQTSGLRKLDRYTVSLPFERPYSTLLQGLATVTTVYLVPVGFDPKRPVGTGPFKYVSFTPGQRSVFDRWDQYWDDPLPYVDKLVMVNYADATSQVNALLSDQADVINLLSQDVLDAISSGGKKTVISPGGGWNPFTMRVDVAPFDDIRVRQALRLVVDRPKMLDVVFGGHGTLGNDVFGIWSPEYDKSLPQREQDIEQAKSLLKAAGQEGLTVELVTADIAQGVVAMAQLFAQQASAAGIKVKLRKVTVTEFFGPNYKKWAFAQDYWYYQAYFAQVNLANLPTSPYNETHFDDPRYNKLYEQALATLDESKRTEISRDMQKISYDGDGYIIPLFPAVIDAHAPNVHGLVKSRTGASLNNHDFRSLWLA